MSKAEKRKLDRRLLRKRLRNRVKGFFTDFIKVGLTPRQRRKRETLHDIG